MANDPVDLVLAQLAMESETEDADDVRGLVEYLLELGASADEIVAAARLESLGPLALDLSIRPEGQCLTFDDFVSSSNLDPRLVRDLWVALGLPENPPMPFPVPPDLADALRVLVVLAGAFGEESVLGFARVIGSSSERVADALANASRVGVEVPQRAGGTPYRDIVRAYATTANQFLPTLWDAVGAVFRRHLVLVSYEGFEYERSQDGVLLHRAIGFVDLVGSTETLRAQSVREMADSINRFERLVGDRVTSAGGRLVKLIGDEAMFVFADPHAACTCALDLIGASPSPVRIGVASGEVVAMHGDYFGPTVNLAARLVSVAQESTLLVSQAVRDELAGTMSFDARDTGPLRGFADVTTAFTVRR